MFFKGGDSPDHVPESPLQDPQSPASNQEREVRISFFNSVLFSLFSFHILKYTFIFLQSDDAPLICYPVHSEIPDTGSGENVSISFCF